MEMYNVLEFTDERFSVQNIALHEQSDYAILSDKLMINAPDLTLPAMLQRKMKRGR